ncbi:Gag-Pol polyprotein [Canna indica]|uniref:Gag-Pol polyprotein n=1 Tax=Canna indica TaxID=4628 RepID=A0AAQ3KS22_9LILI|nr:Gag-Pol polyprotein [Canna indica]
MDCPRRSFADVLKDGLKSSSSWSHPPSTASHAASAGQVPSINDVILSLRLNGCCFNCTRPGHQARNCPRQQVCFLCKHEGHSSRRCSAYRRPKIGSSGHLRSSETMARSAVSLNSTAFNTSSTALKSAGGMETAIYLNPNGVSSSPPARSTTPSSSSPSGSLPERSSMADRLESIRAFIPNSRATEEKAAFMSERCLLVTVQGQLHPKADLAGFLARQFAKYRWHLHLWEHRRLADGRFLITSPATDDSYYKRRLLRTKRILWNHVMLIIDNWKHEDSYELVHSPELQVGLELRGLPLMCWNSDTLIALTSSFGRFEAMASSSLGNSDLTSCKVQLRVRALHLISRFIAAEAKVYS